MNMETTFKRASRRAATVVLALAAAALAARGHSIHHAVHVYGFFDGGGG
jgi:hypothetical protein